MNEKKRRSGRVEVAVPVRVRGMSVQTKFFDEQTQTKLVSKHGLMTQLRNLVDLETEIHVINLENNIGGTFRVVWVNTRAHDGFHDVGLEIVETEGDLWKIYFPPIPPEETEPTAQAWLECQRCHQRLLTPLPETEFEFLRAGLLVARPCDRCKATTPWEFTSQDEPSSELPVVEPEPLEGGGTPARKPGEDLRAKGRAPLRMKIKVTHKKYGVTVEDIRQTENISRNGAYFLSSQSYEVGEALEVILPYKEGEMAIPVTARVVRRDQPTGSVLHGVAIHLEEGKKVNV